MKRANKLMSTAFILLITAFISCVFVQAAVESSNNFGAAKNNFSSIESVYVKITKDICPRVNSAKLYVVDNKDDWADGDDLVDVRTDGASEIVLNFSQLTNITKIWESPKAGNYDIVLDCYKDYEKYDLPDPIDNLNGNGFVVIAVPGKGNVSIGANNIPDHSWQYDSEEPKLTNEMMQVSLIAKGEDIALQNMTIKAEGTGNDTEIDTLEIYVDENNNGKVDEDEILIGDAQPAYTEDDGETNILLDYVLTKDLAKSILIVYVMKQTILKGNFSLKINFIYGTGSDSGKTVQFFGLPLNSSVKTVLPEKTCIGDLALILEPNPSPKDSKVIAKISGLSGCQNQLVVLRTNLCSEIIEEKVSSCTLSEGSCEMNFTAVESMTYYACADKDLDGDAEDIGESDFEDLVVTEITQPEENITAEVNISEEVNETGEVTPGITGGSVWGVTGKFSETGSFFILLEITLLLILFVLVMILFRLRRPVAEKEK